MSKYLMDGTVDLCYIDPPFNSKRDYNQIYDGQDGKDQAQAKAFTDTWTWDDSAKNALDQILSGDKDPISSGVAAIIKGLHEALKESSTMAYLVNMTLRLAHIHRVLKPTGSMYLHCDPTASHYLKIVCDAIFEEEYCFRNEVIWKRTSAHGNARKWGPIHDCILFYTKRKKYTWNKDAVQRLQDSYIENFYKYHDNRGRYTVGDLTGSGIRTGDSGKPWRDLDPTSKGRHWAVPDSGLPDWFIKSPDPDLTPQQRLDEMDTQGLIHWPKKLGGVPRFKRYLDADKGMALQDIILDIPPLSPKDAEDMGYDTQKPEPLLERIIKVSSNEGDVVMDVYCGCGTTIAVAERLKRKWIGIDVTYQAISNVLKRIEDQAGKQAMEAISQTGVPGDKKSAEKLALNPNDPTRKEFEKWAILTYTNNRAKVQEKKGADGGVDGIVRFSTGLAEYGTMVIQVKSGKVSTKDIDALRGVMEPNNAQLATLITYNEPTDQMRRKAMAGTPWKHPLMNGRLVDRITIVTIDQLLDGNRFDFPMVQDAIRTDAKAKSDGGEQLTLELSE